MEQTFERRSAPRIAVDFPVFYHYLPPNPPPTKLFNLSIGGAAVEALDPLPLGSKTSFVIVTHNRDVIECSGQVTYVSPLTESRYRIGVRFNGLSETAHELLAQVTGVLREPQMSML